MEQSTKEHTLILELILYHITHSDCKDDEVSQHLDPYIRLVKGWR